MGKRKTLEIRKHSSKQGVTKYGKKGRPSRIAKKERNAMIRSSQKNKAGIENKGVGAKLDREVSGCNVLPKPASAKQCMPAEGSILVQESSGSNVLTANTVEAVVKTKANSFMFKKPSSKEGGKSTQMRESVSESHATGNRDLRSGSKEIPSALDTSNVPDNHLKKLQRSGKSILMGKDYPLLSKREVKPPRRFEDEHFYLARKKPKMQERTSSNVTGKVGDTFVGKARQGCNSTVPEDGGHKVESDETREQYTEIVKDGGLIFRGNVEEGQRVTNKETHKQVNDRPLSGACKPMSSLDNTEESYSIKNFSSVKKENIGRIVHESKSLPNERSDLVEIPLVLVKSSLKSRDRKYKCVLCSQLFDKLYQYEEHWIAHVEPESSNSLDSRNGTAEEASSSGVKRSRFGEGSTDNSFTVLERNIAIESKDSGMQTRCHVPKIGIDGSSRTTLIDDDLALQNMIFKGSNAQLKGSISIADSAAKVMERKQNEFQKSPDSRLGTKSLSAEITALNSSVPLHSGQISLQSENLDILSQASNVLFCGEESSDGRTIYPRTESEVVSRSLPHNKYDETDPAETKSPKKLKEKEQLSMTGTTSCFENEAEQDSTIEKKTLPAPKGWENPLPHKQFGSVEKKALLSPKKGVESETTQFGTVERKETPKEGGVVVTEKNATPEGNDAVITQTIDHDELKDIVNIDEIISEVVIQNQNCSADSQISDEEDCVEEYEESDNSLGSNENGATDNWQESGGKSQEEHADIDQLISLANDLEKRIRERNIVNSNATASAAINNGGSIGKKMPIKVEKKIHHCELCNKEFDRGKYLKRHIRSCHKSAVSEGLCKHCGLMFAKSSLLRKHQRDVHSKRKITTCFICNQKFTDLEGHMKSVHQKMSLQPLKCPHCWWATDDVLEYKRHVAKHVGEEKPFDCKDCGKRFRTKMLYGMHIRIHEKGFRYPCPVCGHRFNQASNLKRHMSTNHDMADFKPPFQCDMCVQSFLTQEILDKHRARHSQGIFSCKVCGMVFPNRNQLVDHNRLEHKQIRFECHHCDAVYPYGNKLKLHIETKHPDRSSFKCAQCGKEFRRKGFLDNHIREKRCFSTRQCKRCKISFDDAGMERHQKCHLNTETVVNKFCFICGLFLKTVRDVYEHCLEHTRTFGNSNHDSSHMRINDNQGRVDSATAEERHHSFSCHICSEEFDELKDYCGHLSKHDCDANVTPVISSLEINDSAPVVESRGPYGCLVCSDTFDVLKDYCDHLSSHNESVGSPIYCGNCGRNFDIAQNFVGHLLDCLESQGTTRNCEVTNNVEGSASKDEQATNTELPTREIPIAASTRSKAVTSRVGMDAENLADSMVAFHQTPCVLCLSVFEKPKGLHYHLVSNCEFIPTIQCWNCHEVFSSKTKLKGHYDTMRGNCTSANDQEAELVIESCTNCEMRFSSKEHLNEHITEHHTPAVYTCPVCDISYVYRHQLSEHKKSAHKQDMNDFHCCVVCGVRFCREIDLKIHRSVHLRKGFYVPGEVTEEQEGGYVGPKEPVYLGDDKAGDETSEDGSEEDSGSDDDDDEPLVTVAMRATNNYKTADGSDPNSIIPSSERKGEDNGEPLAKRSRKNNKSPMGSEASSILPSKDRSDGDNGTDGTSYKCELCYAHCSSQEKLKAHMQRHAKEALGKLASWGQSHSDKGNSKRGTEGEPSGISDDVWLESQEGKFICVPCRRSFDSEIMYNNHLAVFHSIGQSTVVCELCGRQCTTKANLKTHMRTHSTEMPYVCNICNKGFNQHGNMIRHRQSHGATGVRSVNAINAAENRANDEPEFSCSCCERTFEREDLLLNHLAVLHGIGSSSCICEFCGKQVTSKKNLREHMKIHLKCKPYICEVCGKGFTQCGNFARHRRTHQEKVVEEKSFNCRVCDKTFTSKQKLTLHYGKHKKV